MIPHGLPYCAECAPIAAAQREENRERKAEHRRKKYAKEYNRRRDPKYLEFYRSKEWKITSRAKLQEAGYKCKARLPGCQGLAVEAHHIKPIQTAEGWELRLDWDNLEPVCTACHNGRHQRFKKKTEDGVLDMREIVRNLSE
jgi:5-methylcytosine-specific restriction protein A